MSIARKQKLDKFGLPRLNVRLLRRVQRHILAEPRRLDMSTWRMPSDKAPCGTQACIGGWTNILTNTHGSLRAQEVLNLTNGETEGMFYNWNHEVGRRGAREVFHKINLLIRDRKAFVVKWAPSHVGTD